MKLTIVAAIAKNSVIGKNNSLPWHIPEDLKRFKELTSGSPVVMGRKTYESIGRPLPNRMNIILTKKGFQTLDEIKIFKQINELLNFLDALDQEIFIIGGSEIYNLLEPHCTKMVLTHVMEEFKGDAFFSIDLNNWKEVKSESFTDEKSKIECEIKTYIKD